MKHTGIARRIAGIMASLLFASGMFAGTALAKPLDLSGSAPATPGMVSPGSYVRFDVSFTNPTSSNISQLYMTTKTADTFVALVSGPSQGTCDTSGPLLTCDFGALNAYTSASFVVVYRTPSSGSGNVDFIFTSTGDTGSDQGKNSHGDARTITGAVTVSTSRDFSGSYLYDPNDLTVADNLNVSRQNPQGTKATGVGAGVPLTVGEYPPNTYVCPGESTASCFGEWSVVSLDNGNLVPGGFEVVLVYDKVPGNNNSVRFVHLVGPGQTPIFITQSCSSSLTVNCIKSVTSSQGDVFYTLIIDNNGPMRGY